MQLSQAEVSWSPPEGEGHANLVGYQIKLRSNISMEDFQGAEVFMINRQFQPPVEDFQGPQVFWINTQFQTPMKDLQGPQIFSNNMQFLTPGQDLTGKC